MPEYDKKSVTAQLEQLQLEETQERVDKSRADRESRRRRHQQLHASIIRNEAIKRAQQEACWHRKGGKGVQQLSNGNDTNFAVVKHQLCHGPIIVICQRCHKVWEPPVKPAKGADAEVRAQYKIDLVEYNRALNFPTDNEQSGTQLFVVTENAA
jgi:hypothetical protein